MSESPCSKILVVGAGGREHALALRLLESAAVSEVAVLPGNAGTKDTPGWATASGKRLFNLAGDVLENVREHAVDMVVIGPEAPLAEGLSDALRAANILVYGPSQRAAQLETSKVFMKRFAERNHIRTSRYCVVSDMADLKHALGDFREPPVVKADGLCAGKGVTVASSHDEARNAAEQMLRGQRFGAAGSTIILEERVRGREASLHAICDGKRAFMLPAAQDHKRIFDGDKGPNTGGMGTYAPASLIDAELFARIEREIYAPALAAMAAEGTPFIGTLFANVMITEAKDPVLLEFNVRFGDPETQVLTSIVEGDWAEALASAACGEFSPESLRVSEEAAVCVVLAAEGYPERPRTGDRIHGIEAAEALSGVRVFHAGTQLHDQVPVTAGGRVLGVTARGASLELARKRAYEAVACVDFAGMQFRRDIASRV